MPLKTTWMAIPALSMLLLVLTGCGNHSIPTGAVSGTITINGKPVEGVVVTFVPQNKTRPSIGTTNAAGYYEAQLLANQSGGNQSP